MKEGYSANGDWRKAARGMSIHFGMDLLCLYANEERVKIFRIKIKH